VAAGHIPAGTLVYYTDTGHVAPVPPAEPWSGYSEHLAAAMATAGLHESAPVTQAQWDAMLAGLLTDPPG